MNIITDIFAALVSIVNGFVSVLVAGFDGIIQIFYDASPEGGGLTVLGVLLLIGLGMGLVYFVFRFIRGLIG